MRNDEIPKQINDEICCEILLVQKRIYQETNFIYITQNTPCVLI